MNPQGTSPRSSNNSSLFHLLPPRCRTTHLGVCTYNITVTLNSEFRCRSDGRHPFVSAVSEHLFSVFGSSTPVTKDVLSFWGTVFDGSCKHSAIRNQKRRLRTCVGTTRCSGDRPAVRHRTAAPPPPSTPGSVPQMRVPSRQASCLIESACPPHLGLHVTDPPRLGEPQAASCGGLDH